MDAKNTNVKPWPKQGLSDHVRAAPAPVEPRPSREQAEIAVRTLIAYAGDDPTREGLLETPKRVVGAYDEIYQGYHAAAANHNIFYDNRGRARSVGEVYSKLANLFDSAQTVAFAQGGVTQTAVARSGAAPPLPPPVTVAAKPVKDVPARATRVASAAPPIPPAPIPIPTPDTAGTTQALARASEQLPPPPPPRPSFESMFTDRVSQPLAPTVATLWGAPSSGGPQTARAVQVFDLFSDMRPNERKLGDKA